MGLLTGKTALITGAARGIGKAIAINLQAKVLTLPSPTSLSMKTERLLRLKFQLSELNVKATQAMQPISLSLKK